MSDVCADEPSPAHADDDIGRLRLTTRHLAHELYRSISSKYKNDENNSRAATNEMVRRRSLNGRFADHVKRLQASCIGHSILQLAKVSS